MFRRLEDKHKSYFELFISLGKPLKCLGDKAFLNKAFKTEHTNLLMRLHGAFGYLRLLYHWCYKASGLCLCSQPLAFCFSVLVSSCLSPVFAPSS